MGTERNTGAEDIKAKALKLSGLAEYQAGAVVSRTLIDKKIGTVTIFAFDEGQGLSEHTAPFDAFVQIVDGEASITISGRTLTAATGEIVIMPAGEPHSLRAVQQFKMLLTMIRA
jgi:quercetin dioxygenase-like cupin family protein